MTHYRSKQARARVGGVVTAVVMLAIGAFAGVLGVIQWGPRAEAATFGEPAAATSAPAPTTVVPPGWGGEGEGRYVVPSGWPRGVYSVTGGNGDWPCLWITRSAADDRTASIIKTGQVNRGDLAEVTVDGTVRVVDMRGSCRWKRQR